MKKFLDLISEEMKNAFEAAGYDRELGKVTLSNRPDLCEYQCNGAMAGAKLYKKAPIMIAKDVAEKCGENGAFLSVEAVPPGFLNLKIKESFVADYLADMAQDEKFGLENRKIPAKSLWITAALTWQSRFMWGICARRLSARALSGLQGTQAMT